MIVKAAVENSPSRVAESAITTPRAPVPMGRFMTWLFSTTALSKSLGLYLPATVAFRLINFGRILLLTWWMSQQQFGLLNMILLALNVLTPLCSLGLNEAVTRYVPQYESRGSLRHFLQQSVALLLIATTVSIAVLWSFSERFGVFFYAQVFTDARWLAEFRADAPELTKVSAVVIGLLIIYFYLLAVMKGLRMFTALSVMEMFHGVIFLVASAIAIGTRHLSALTMTGLYGISLLLPITIFGVGLLFAVSHRTIEETPVDEARLVKKLLQFSVWTTLAGITWQALVYYPTWFLNKVNGHEAVAVFSAVRQIGQFILVGAMSVVTVVMTTVTKTWETRGREAAQRQLSLAFRGTGLGLFLLCAVLALSRHGIIRMFKADYALGADVLPLHLMFFLVGAYLAFLPVHFHLTEKTRHSFWPWAIGVAANMLYAFWLAGPGLATVKSHPIWQTLSKFTSVIFITGFSDPMGLGNAAWCGVFAIMTSLLLCIVLIQAECCKLDRGTFIIIAAAGLLGLNGWLLAVGTLVLLLISLRTHLIFSEEERRKVLGYLLNSVSHVPSVRRLTGWKNGA